MLVTVSEAFTDAATSAARAEADLRKVPIDGGERRKLETKVSGMSRFSVHPDGRQIAYALTEPAGDNEIWMLENFLPTSKSGR